MGKLFGFSIEDSDVQRPGSISPVPENNADGVDYYASGGFGGAYVDLEGVYRTEYELIRRYREMALYPEVDSAIEDIVNEAIVSDLYESPVQVELSNVNASDKVKNIIRDEFKYIKELLDFDKRSHEIFRNWYIDGRMHYLKVIDMKNPQDGIMDLRYIPPTKIKFVRKLNDKAATNGMASQVLTKNNTGGQNPLGRNNIFSQEIDEYYVYTPGASNVTGYGGGMGNNSTASIKIAKDSIAYCNSGLVDRNNNTTLSWLHKAIKSTNQLRMIEDAIVIYRLSRAPERRIFYIDVGNLPKVKAEQYLQQVMSRYRNKQSYNAQTGEMKNDKKVMSMLEDFWLPRREGGRGTEISTLPGGQNLGEISDIEYFRNKLYASLGVPSSRSPGGSEGFNMGRSSEILRDEVKFSKFVARLRKRFAGLFSDLLRTQLILKNVITPDDWEGIKDNIQYDFLYDNHFAELKETELFQERLNLLAQAEPYIGKYYSQEYIRSKILRQTDGEMEEQDKLIEKEIADGTIPDPSTLDPITGEPLPAMEGEGDPAGAMADMAGAAADINGAAGAVPTDPAPPKLPKSGEGEI
ncbi:portal protein [Synechococcus phage S-CAM7]|uniref:Portal protein n=2 Tax=Viruses TaxID=10239 RepID=A0A1D8KTW0_9CAUD|nr:portal protein [Synechococcus phage S-CAM7]AOV62067.1 portal vertex of the head [Synechococcus phage S-CAM7]QLF86194.1 portal protein [Synechococcus phage S-CAM7]